MATKTVKVPGKDHPITVEPHKGRIVVTHGGVVIADTRDPLTLQESTYPAVHYIPRKDVDMAFLKRTEHATYCPYKGDAAYYSISVEGEGPENAVWTYEAPYDAVAEIKDYLAFYTDRVDSYEVERDRAND